MKAEQNALSLGRAFQRLPERLLEFAPITPLQDRDLRVCIAGYRRLGCGRVARARLRAVLAQPAECGALRGDTEPPFERRPACERREPGRRRDGSNQQVVEEALLDLRGVGAAHDA